MGLTQTKIRIILRWAHIALSLVVMCYVYSPFGEHLIFRRLMQFLIVPALAFTGLWIWKFNAFNKFFKIR